MFHAAVAWQSQDDKETKGSHVMEQEHKDCRKYLQMYDICFLNLKFL